MTIIFEKGDEFWIESHQRTLAMVAGAGSVFQNFNLNKPGHIIGFVETCASIDTAEGRDSIGSAEIVDNGGAVLPIGVFRTNVTVRVGKIATASSFVYISQILLFMRGRG